MTLIGPFGYGRQGIRVLLGLRQEICPAKRCFLRVALGLAA